MAAVTKRSGTAMSLSSSELGRLWWEWYQQIYRKSLNANAIEILHQHFLVFLVLAGTDHCQDAEHATQPLLSGAVSGFGYTEVFYKAGNAVEMLSQNLASTVLL